MLAAEIDAALDRRDRLARFGALLGQRYGADVRAPRVVHLRRMILLGVGMFVLFAISGFVTSPAWGWVNLTMRIMVMTPTALLIFVLVGRVGDRLRENLVAFGIVGAAAIPVGIFALDDGPIAPLGVIEILLTIVYANTTLALRFPQACFVTGLTLAATLLSLPFKPLIGAGLAMAIVLQMVTGVIYSLAANYRIERSERRNYLLTLRETLRTDALTAHNSVLAALSTTDALTGLHNRHFLDARSPALDAAIRRGERVAVILADVDFFKIYNDHHGHAAGDLCLRRVATALRLNMPDADVIRFGGEEFLILLHGRTIGEACDVASEARRRVEALAMPHIQRPDGGAMVTVSLGVAGTVDGYREGVQHLIERADAALYRAKALGRNRVQSGALISADAA